MNEKQVLEDKRKLEIVINRVKERTKTVSLREKDRYNISSIYLKIMQSQCEYLDNKEDRPKQAKIAFRNLICVCGLDLKFILSDY